MAEYILERNPLNVIFLTAEDPFPSLTILKHMAEYILERNPLNVIFLAAEDPFP